MWPLEYNNLNFNETNWEFRALIMVTTNTSCTRALCHPYHTVISCTYLLSLPLSFPPSTSPSLSHCIFICNFLFNLSQTLCTKKIYVCQIQNYSIELGGVSVSFFRWNLSKTVHTTKNAHINLYMNGMGKKPFKKYY